jgi:alpha-N-arabinofuranosidase
MASHANDYDTRRRAGPKVFVGEWATRVGSPTPTMSAAPGDASWMVGMERNADLVIMHSYVPLFVNVNPGGMQWQTDLDRVRHDRELRIAGVLGSADVRRASR